jgi:3-phytase
MIRRVTSVCTLALLSAACATAEPEWPQGMAALGDPPKAVPARGETVVDRDPEVDADDPALWADRADPSRALMFGTDKSDGLYVHDLDGAMRQFLPSGALNNVDLRTGFRAQGREQVLVAASSDVPGKWGLHLYLMDPATLETRPYGFLPTAYEPYGFCMGRRGAEFHLVANTKAGTVHQYRVTAGETGPAFGPERRLTLGSQLEGCVVDDETDTLYVGEEDVGFWSFDFDPAGSDQPTLIARVDGERLRDDVEGLTIIRDGDAKYLFASSQGDSTFAVYRMGSGLPAYVGRFAVVASDGVDEVTETDGVDAWSGPIGRFPEGMLAMHDTDDAPHPGQQNYKFVDWRDVKAALGL